MTCFLPRCLLACLLWICFSGVGPAFGAPAGTTREKLDVVVLLDNSGSMLRDEGQPGNDVHFTRLTAVQYLLEKMAPGDRIALVTFDSAVHTDPEASRLQDVAAPGMPASFYAGVRRIAAGPQDSTDMAAGLRRAQEILHTSGAPKHRRFLVFLTDGTPNPARGENTPAGLVAYAGQLKRQGIVLHTVGLGNLSSVPAEADAARHLLVQMATQGGGAPHLARTADDLPALFGSIFAQLVGHEVSQPVLSGGQAQFTLSPGTHNLRVVATNDGAAPQIELTDPQGHQYSATTLLPLLPDRQTALLAACSVNDPVAGTWTVHAVRGALEVAWEPNFEATLREPAGGVPVPSHAPVHLIVDVRQKNSTLPPTLPQGRVEADYRVESNTKPVVLALTPVVGVPGRFEGDLPESGIVGPHDLVVRCFRQGSSGEEEGGPARAVLPVEDLPVLAVQSPTAGTFDALRMPIPIQAQVRLAGAPLNGSDAKELQVHAQLQGHASQSSTTLQPTADGEYRGALLSDPPAGAAILAVTLSGRYAGETLIPQTVSVPLTLTPRPTLVLSWPSASSLTVGPNDRTFLSPKIQSSAGTAMPLRFTVTGLPHAAFDPGTLSVPAYQPSRILTLNLQGRGIPPGHYPLTVTAQTEASDVDIVGGQWQTRVFVPTWLERNRWWLYPAIGLSMLLALLIAAGLVLWAREQARRRRQMHGLLSGAAVYVPHTTQAYRPPAQATLLRRSFTFGGPGADVFIPDPQRPGEPLFAEPCLRIGVLWRAGQARLDVTQEGTQTQWFDLDGKLLAPPLSPTEGGVTFRVEPEHVLVRVNSEWTY